MRLHQLWTRARTGVWSGLFAALVLVAVSLALRWAAGIGTLLELLGDRIAPMLGLYLFFHLIGFFRSYVLLKQFGIVSMLANEIAAGIVFGIFYAWQRRVQPARATGRLIGAVAVAFLVLTAFLWGNLSSTNYLGLPPSSALPASLLGLALSAAAFVWALVWAAGLLDSTSSSSLNPPDAGRRNVLLGGTSAAFTAFSAFAFAHFYRVSTYGYDGTVNAGPDLPPITPNERFYSVTKNNVDPDPSLAAWALELKGHIESALKLHLSDLESMPQRTQQTTLQCISNPVGGTLNSNAEWTGVPLSELLTRAGASRNAVQVMLYGADGFIDVIPIEAALHPYTLVVHKMNGVNLPVHHGFPVRLIVPGYVGEKSVKWLTAIEVRETPGEGFYEKQGWGPHFAIENASRFDAPADGDEFKLKQPVHLKGTAFAGDRGVRAVQVSSDGGDSWETAELTYPGTPLTWAQWSYDWTPDEAGDVTLSVRCIDGRGAIQTEDAHGPGPGQSAGYHELNVKVAG